MNISRVVAGNTILKITKIFLLSDKNRQWNRLIK